VKRFIQTAIWLLLAMTISGPALTVRMASAQTVPCIPMNHGEEGPLFCAGDHRVNAYDAIAPITAYCEGDGSINVWGIVQGQGYFLYNVSGQQLSSALQLAETTGQDQLIQTQQGRDLWALHSGELELHDEGTGYNFVFAGDACGAVSTSGSPNYVAAQNQNSYVQPTATTAPKPSATPTSRSQDNVAAPAGGLVSFTTGYEKLHKAPGASSDILAYVPRGAAIAVFGRDRSWYWVKITYRGTPGWVSSQYAGLTDTDMRQLRIVQ